MTNKTVFGPKNVHELKPNQNTNKTLKPHKYKTSKV